MKQFVGYASILGGHFIDGSLLLEASIFTVKLHAVINALSTGIPSYWTQIVS